MIQHLQNAAVILDGFNLYSITFRIMLAGLIGGIIGWERERHGRAAGLRTHVLVCLGAVMTVLVGLYVSLKLHMDSEPMRIAAQVISGIGFLGAGAILTRDKSQITGLTTSAGLWATASLALAVGVGFYSAAIVGFIAVEITLITLARLEAHTKHSGVFYLELKDVDCANDFFDRQSARFNHWQITEPKSGSPAHIGMICTFKDPLDGEKAIAEIRGLDYVSAAIPLSK